MYTNSMTRPQFTTGEIYHIYNRGVEKRKIFYNDKDRFRFIHSMFEFNDEAPALNIHYYFGTTKKVKTPILFVINKTEDKPKPFIDSYRRLGEDFETVLEVSAKSHKNLNRIVDTIFEKIPEGEPFYPIGQFTNISNEKWLAEIIREKLFLRLREEVPYSIHVIIDESEKRPNGTFYVQARILTSEERYKGMIVGKGGRGIKEIGQSTRHELETVMDCPVFLDLSVEHDPYWVEEYT